MNKNNKTGKLADATVNVRIKIAGIWASVVLCYLYGDFFGLFKTGKLARIQEGFGPFGAVSQESLLTVAMIMAVPCLMVALTLVLKAAICRWVNLVVAAIFILFLAATMLKSYWHFYLFLGVIEILLKIVIIWFAWHWPKNDQQD